MGLLRQALKVFRENADDPGMAESASRLGRLLEKDLPSESAALLLFRADPRGEPLGEVVDHAALAARLDGLCERYDLAPGEGVLGVAPASTEAGVWQLLWPLAALLIDEPLGALAATSTVITTVALWPLAMVPKLMVIRPLGLTLPLPWLGLAPWNVSWEGSWSVTTTVGASLGPLSVAVIVN